MVSFNSEVSFYLLVTMKSLTIIVLGSVCAFKSSDICLIKLGGPTFSVYVLTIAIFS
jgi:hypothetical protein